MVVLKLIIPGTMEEEFKPHSILDHHHPDHHNNHVHFDGQALNEDEEESNGIRYKLTEPEKNIVTIHLGFLQIKHRYNLALQLPLNLCAATQKLVTTDSPVNGGGPVTIKLEQPETSNGMPSLWCKLLEYNNELDAKSSGEPVLDLVVEFMAHKERFLKEEMRLLLNDVDEITVIFTARVLGKDKGTPLLKNGVQSVSIELDDEDEGTSSDATGILH